MSPPPVLWLVVVAMGCATLAIFAGANIDYAVGAGLAAVMIAAAAGAVLYWTHLEPPAPRSPPAPVPEPSRSASAFGQGILGREEIVLMLDRLDRAARHPELPSRPVAEIREVMEQSTSEFHRYVSRRLDELEQDA